MVNICLIGYGKWGKILYKKLKYITNVSLVLRKKNYSIKKIKDADWVVIATPDSTHYKIIKDCIKIKKNIFCEKPLVKKFEQAKKLYSLAKANKVKLIVSDLSGYKKKIPLSSHVNTFQRFKNSPEDKNIITKRYDLLYRFAYHDIGYIYHNVKNKSLKLIKIIYSKRILKFYLEFENIKFSFLYDTKNKKKIYSLNKINLNQRNDILKKMLNDFIIKKKLFINNEKKSLFIIKILEKIKKKMFLSRY